MIGNDIIDIKLFLQETNWKRPNFLGKLFTKKEQEQIISNKNPEIVIATLWAMKESCYKAHQRKYSLPRKYNPSDFECQIHGELIETEFNGTVEIFDTIYSAEIIKTEDFIHCTVRNPNQKILQKIYEEAVNIKSLLKAHYSNINDLSIEHISIEKDENFVPQLFYQDEKRGTQFSISHHGKFAAFVLALTNS